MGMQVPNIISLDLREGDRRWDALFSKQPHAYTARPFCRMPVLPRWGCACAQRTAAPCPTLPACLRTCAARHCLHAVPRAMMMMIDADVRVNLRVNLRRAG